uniref:uncharacterized protein LOC120336150 isoform X1 n=1 Tax=Styela clava TaxID=7725 RepID=UPI00193AD37E|nr:uncharacterized protein LOC120336150 isoform X1 [Styela clava]
MEDIRQINYHIRDWAIVFSVIVCSMVASQNVQCNNNQTIERRQICDSIIDCEDGSDEIYSGTGFKCIVAREGSEKKRSRRCVLPQSMVHDDVIDCADGSDKCSNSRHEVIPSLCFRCLDGSMIISRTQVCDGIIDCPDLSDECICVKRNSRKRRSAAKLLRNPICDQMRYSESLRHTTDETEASTCRIGEILCNSHRSKEKRNSTKHDVIDDEFTYYCLKLCQVCDGIIDCPLGDDEEYCPRSDYFCNGHNLIGTFCDGKVDCPNFDDECSPDCWLRHDFCDDVTNSHDNGTFLQCNEATTNDTGKTELVSGDKVCNGVSDCVTTGNDEAKCSTSTHFYCLGKSPQFINWTHRFNGARDCDSGSDECGRMIMTTSGSFMMHRDALIRSPFLIAAMWVMGFLALFGNAVVIWQTLAELLKDWDVGKLGKLAKCNRIFVANLAASDFLMGIYLLIIGIQSFVSNGKYCVTDRAWRSSSTCVLLGFINKLSSQTSVLILVQMTSYRLYGTLNPFKVESSKVVHSSVITCIATWIISIIVATIPLIDTFMDYFTESYWLPVTFLPFDKVRETGLREAVIRLNTVTYNSTGKLQDYSWTIMLKFLRDLDIVGIHPDWEFNRVIPFGFYNWYAVCIPNLYPKPGDTAWLFATLIVIYNFCAFCYITIAYIVIYKTSSRPAVRKSVRKRSKQWRRDNKAMQKKIFLLVATDVACWLPICLMSILKLAGKISVNRDAVDITGAVLLPINSAINPLIYSSALWRILQVFKEKICPRPKTSQFMHFHSFREKSDSLSSEVKTNNSVKKKRNVRFLQHEDNTDLSYEEEIPSCSGSPLEDTDREIELRKDESTETPLILSDTRTYESMYKVDKNGLSISDNDTINDLRYDEIDIVRRQSSRKFSGKFWNDPVTSSSFDMETSL